MTGLRAASSQKSFMKQGNSLKRGSGLRLFLNKLMGDWQKLGLYTPEEQDIALQKAVEEISPKHYYGPRPPVRCTEEAFEGREILGFCWDSRHFGKLMYFRFGITEDRLWVSSIHVSKKS